SMPWQARVMRMPGGLAVVAGLLTLLSCLFSWWAVFDRSTGGLIEYSLAPFRGVSASSGSRWSDMAALNSLDGDDVEAIRALTVYVGIMLVVAALCLIAGGLLVALDRVHTLGAGLMLLGTVFLGYARVPAEGSAIWPMRSARPAVAYSAPRICWAAYCRPSCRRRDSAWACRPSLSSS